jgi:hypothetical protein
MIVIYRKFKVHAYLVYLRSSLHSPWDLHEQHGKA